jgi:predicted AlkP superfamily pyrophosphatase or phosphodiesterase
MKQKIIVFSADAMVYEDVEYLKTLPNFQKYLSGGAEVKKVRSIYPTVTYPVHVSMVAGNYPDRHGVISNLEFHPGQIKLPWTWFHHWQKCGDIFDAAKKGGYSTGSVFWPVTAGHPSIDYLVAAYGPQAPGETVREAHTRAGAGEDVLKIIEKHSEGMTEIKATDEFRIGCACDIIRQFRPDLFMVHPVTLDHLRHYYGVFNDKVTGGIEETDKQIGQIMAAVEDTGNLKNTNFFLVSDHGQMEIKRIINLNVLLARHGFIKTNSEGALADWDAYSLSNGMSAMVFLKNSGDRELCQKIEILLRQLCEEGIYGISQVFSREEILKKEHLGGNFSFVLESDGYTSFGDNWNQPLVKNNDNSDYRYGKATHGYLPDKGPQPILLAKGPSIRDGAVVEQGNIIDEAPTYARILNICLPDAEGKSIDEILEI